MGVGLVVRSRRLGMWIGVAAAVTVGVAALTHAGGGSPRAGHVRAAGSPATDSDAAAYGRRIRVPQAALATSRQFIREAVLREDLAASWSLAAPALRGGYTRAEWLTGTIPVVPYPANEFASSTLNVVRSRERDILLLVLVTGKPGGAVGAQDFLLELVPIRHSWRVSYWAPRGHVGALPAIP